MHSTDPTPRRRRLVALRRPRTRGQVLLLVAIMLATAVATLLVAWVLVTMFERKVEARTPFVRLVEVDESMTDPRPWGVNWPAQFEGWKATAGDKFHGGSSALTQSKLETAPWLKRLYAGYAFSIDYREARGHAYMLYDQGVTERVTQKPQSGACLHCHASTNVLYRRVGLEAMGREVTDAALSESFDMEAVQRGFEELSTKTYAEVLAELLRTPDGTPDDHGTVFPTPPGGGFTGEFAGRPLPENHPSGGAAHPVSCVDCHDPSSMAVRVTRPGFVRGIASFAAGDGDATFLPSVEQWRRGDRDRPYDPNVDASRQEMRSFVCAQCHVEYYCANKMTLEFPWSKGLRMDDLEAHWEETTFDDGSPFLDYRHGETGAPIFKVQHPEFELWSQGIHARSGVSCSDCHMPYRREGAAKFSSHDVQSPLETIDVSCRPCHPTSEVELMSRVESIQERTMALMDRAADAMTDMLDAILEAKASGVEEADLAEVHELQRKAMWRLDYISSENSRGFHADQEAARILGESIDYSRLAQAAALRLRAPEAPSTDDLEIVPVRGVSDERP